MTNWPHSQKVLLRSELRHHTRGLSTSAMAKVDICNQSGHAMDVALAYTAKDPLE